MRLTITLEPQLQFKIRGPDGWTAWAHAGWCTRLLSFVMLVAATQNAQAGNACAEIASSCSCTWRAGECVRNAVNAIAFRELPVFSTQGGHSLRVRAIDVSPDGDTLATASNDESIKLWNIASGLELRTLAGGRGPIYAVRFSRSGNYVAAGGWDGSVRVWAADSGELVTSIPLPVGTIERLAWAPDGMQLAVALGQRSSKAPKSVAFVTLGANPIVLQSEELGAVDSLESAESGRTVEAIVGRSQYRFSALTGELQHKGSAALVRSSKFVSADGRFQAKYSADARNLEITSLRDGKLAGTLAVHRYLLQPGNLMKYFRLAASPRDRSFAIAGVNNEIDAWLEAPSTARLRHYRLQVGARVSEVRFDSAGERILYVVSDELRSWRPADDSTAMVKMGREIVAIAVQHEPAGRVAVLTDQKLVVLGDEPLRVLDEVPNSNAKEDGHDSGLTWRAGGSLVKASGWQVVLWRDLRDVQYFRLPDGGLNVAVAGLDGSVFVGGGPSKWLLGHDGKPAEQVTRMDIQSGATMSGRVRPILGRVAVDADGLKLASSTLLESQVRSLAIGGNDMRVAAGTDRGNVSLYRPLSMEPAGTFAAGAGDITDLAFLSAGNILMSTGLDQAIRFWDTRDPRTPIATVVSRNGNWTVVTSSGLFDTNAIEDASMGAWVMPDKPMQALPPEVFLRDYFEPGVLGKVLAGERLRQVASIATLNRSQPLVSIDSIRLDSTTDRHANVTVNVASALQGAGPNRSQSGVHDLRLFRDGQLVGQWPDPTLRVATSQDIAAWREASRIPFDKGQTRASHTFRVALPHREQGKPVRFTAYAFNEDRVKSATVQRDATGFPAPAVGRKPRAYIVTVGVSAYDGAFEDRQLKLDFPAGDARAMGNALGRIKDYEVVQFPLISERAQSGAAPSMQATKANIRAALRLLAGSEGEERDGLLRVGGVEPEAVAKLRKATPDDVVVVAFSGHGQTESDGRFFLVPSDARLDDGTLRPSVVSSLISSDDLSDWLREIDAGQIALIIDACHSAASVESPGFRPGPMGDRGLGQLAYDKGMMILAATQAADVAREFKGLNHGLLTLALTQDAFESEGSEPVKLRADLDGDGGISLREWLQYGERRVPSLYAAIRGGRENVVRLDAPVSGTTVSSALDSSRVWRESVARKAQTPTLFDFKPQRLKVELTQ